MTFDVQAIVSIIQLVSLPIVAAGSAYAALYVKDKDREQSEKTKAELREELKVSLQGAFAEFENRLMMRMSEKFASSGGIQVSMAEISRRMQEMEQNCRERRKSGDCR